MIKEKKQVKNLQELLNRQQNLVDKLNYYTEKYDEGRPEISDKEWDGLYFELVSLEKETGKILPNSPTSSISYTVVNQLEKVEHNHQMLSLEKTKSIEEIKNFIGKKPYLAMCKLDGLTCTIHYLDGKLISAETRGNGIEGENVLHNALVINSLPNFINYKEELIIDGEIICTYKDFKDFEDEYKNPRNFAAGSIRLLDSKECAQRKLTFVAWEVIKGLDQYNFLSEKLDFLQKALGFNVVPRLVNLPIGEDVIEQVKTFAKILEYPIDGAVFKFDDIVYGQSLGQTAHHFKNAMAYKFYDETYETQLLDIEWTMGRTGTLTPVAIFNTIDIDGADVSRASLHNVSIMAELLGYPFVGQTIFVYKANQIIPQVYSAETEDREGKPLIAIPQVCPICGQGLTVRCELGTKMLVCANPACEGKLINQLDHFCGKKGLDIKGLSVATLEKLIEWDWVSEPADLYQLQDKLIEWSRKSGFGAKSVSNILAAIEKSKTQTLSTFLCAIGIPLIGPSAVQELIKYVDSYEDFRKKVDEHYDFTRIPTFAESKCSEIWKFDYSKADKVYAYLNCSTPTQETEEEQNLQGITVVITGKLNSYKNRDLLQQDITKRGGKVASSVSKSTSYLINNDTTSTSSKNLTAKKFNVPIINEEEFIKKFLTL